MQKEQQMQTKPSQPTETVSRPTGIKMALLLFWEFIKLGAFTFGSGWSIIAQMEQEFVDKRHWVEQSDLLELIAVGKSLPGIMVANIVLLFGYQLAGPLGGILPVTSVVVFCVGIFGSIFGEWILRRCGVRDAEARGFALGAAAHGIGTARAIEMGAVEGALSGLAMALMGLATALLMPLMERYLY